MSFGTCCNMSVQIVTQQVSCIKTTLFLSGLRGYVCPDPGYGSLLQKFLYTFTYTVSVLKCKHAGGMHVMTGTRIR